MARKPSFDFERRERAKNKALKRTDKAKAKAEKKTTDPAADAGAQSDVQAEEAPD